MRNLQVGDRVVIPSTMACGSCSYCRAGYYAQWPGWVKVELEPSA